MIFLQILLLILGFVMLSKGADWFVDGASAIATKLKIPQIIIGLTIVALGTSAPECAVSVSSALKGSADITIGNVVGSNIMNILIILGLSAVITPLVVQSSTVKVDMPVMIASTILVALLGLDGTISRIDGIIILACFIAYMTYLFVSTSKQRKEENGEEKEENNENERIMPLYKSIILTIVGLLLIIFGSDFAVDAATEIAKALGISDRFIGLTVIALGTSLPELFTSVTAARKKNADIAIGNIVGSCIFNLLLIVGLTATITPVPFASQFRIDAIVAFAATLILFIPSLISKKVNRPIGVIMLLGYAAYFVYLVVA